MEAPYKSNENDWNQSRKRSKVLIFRLRKSSKSQETIQKIRDNVNIREPNLVIGENIMEPTEERKESVSDSELSANEHAEENISDNASVIAPEMREPPDLS